MALELENQFLRCSYMCIHGLYFFEFVNITDFTNFNCFIFPKSLYIFESQYESSERVTSLFGMLNTLTVLMMSEMTTKELCGLCCSS